MNTAFNQADFNKIFGERALVIHPDKQVLDVKKLSNADIQYLLNSSLELVALVHYLNLEGKVNVDAYQAKLTGIYDKAVSI
jgi:hypothetical protein